MIIDCPRCHSHAMHPARERGVMSKCAACSHEIPDYIKSIPDPPDAKELDRRGHPRLLGSHRKSR